MNTDQVHLAASLETARADFTPGPWQRSGARIKLGAEDCLRVGPDGFPIALVPIGKTQQEHAGAIADATLIAAAPDLLEALQRLVEKCDDSDGSCYGTLSTSFVRQIASEAIVKATGGQS